MCKNIPKLRLPKWCLLMLILSSWLLLGTSGSNKPQSTNEDKKPYIEQFKNELSQEPNNKKRDGILLAMFQYDAIGAYESVLNEMMNDSAMAQKTAVQLISNYHVEVPIYPGDSLLLGKRYPGQIMDQYEVIVDQLNHLSRASRCIDIKIAAFESLIRMGAADQSTLDQLFDIAAGEGRETWEYAMDSRWVADVTKEVVEMMMQRDAIALIAVMSRHHICEDKAKAYLKSILNMLDPASKLFEMIEDPVRKAIGPQ
jgi:hypothetical protein